MDKKKHIIYIDESGIHKTRGHSTFVFVYVDIENKESIKNEILAIEKSLNISNFHWSDFSSRYGWSIRKVFIQKINRLPFKFKYRILVNPIYSNNELYNTLFSFLDENTIHEINIDGKQPKWFERQIKKNLRDRGLSIRKIKTVNDRSEPAIRLADAIANVIRVYYDNPQKLIIELFNALSFKKIK